MQIENLIEEVRELEAKYLADVPEKPEHRVAYDMVQAIRRRTSNYENPSQVETTRHDVRPILAREGVELDEWMRHKGTDKRSEVESIEWLVGFIKSEFEKKPADNGGLRKLKFKAKALKLKLLLELD